MDCNEDITKSNSEVQQLMHTCNLIDPLPLLMPRQSQLPMYKRGQKRLDVMLVSENVMPYITAEYHLAYDVITFSDHRALLVDFNVHGLMGHETNTPTSITGKILSMKSLCKVEVYKEHILQEFTNSHLEQQIEELWNVIRMEPCKWDQCIENMKACQNVLYEPKYGQNNNAGDYHTAMPGHQNYNVW